MDEGEAGGDGGAVRRRRSGVVSGRINLAVSNSPKKGGLAHESVTIYHGKRGMQIMG